MVWPMDLLDVPGLLAGGFRPTPFRQFIVKVHGRCNLACDYCYLYEMADATWRSRPRSMSRDTAVRVCERIAEHATAHHLDHVEVVFHGGEPLLAGVGLVAEMTGRLRRLLAAEGRVDFTIQTNGVLLDEPVLADLSRLGVRVGVSLDGDQAANDRHRRFPHGGGSHDAVAAALRRLSAEPYRDVYAGLLCVVDLRSDPVRTYESLLEFAPPRMDFLLPHGNWTEPPPGVDLTGATAPYGRWLIAAFDRWYGAPRQETEVRLFGEIVNVLLGGHSGTEQVGLSPAALIVVDTDGSLEQVDTLRSAYHGAAGTELNVRTHAFDAALRHPAVVARQIGVEALGDTCRACAIRDVCGGGYYPHRYREGSGFRHRSVYCADLTVLIRHIRDRLRQDLAALRARQA